MLVKSQRTNWYRGGIMAISFALSALAAFASAGDTTAPETTCSWNVVSSPNTNMPENILRGVAVVTASDIRAVGVATRDPSAPGATLIEHWDGSSWSIVRSPGPRGASALLDGVSAISSADVWAVGTAQGRGSARTLTEHWDGQRWQIVPSPSLTVGSQPADNTLTAVIAINSNDVWAVGYAASITIGETLIEHWNGTSWTIVPSPNPGEGSGFFDDRLFGVTAVSASDIWTAGESTALGEEHNLIEHWDGSTWSVVVSPHFPNTNVDFMNAISAISANDIWAVGAFTIPNAEGSPLQTGTLYWDGTNWSIGDSPSPSSSFDILNGVAAVSSNDVWAVGSFQADSGLLNTLIEHWDGTSWSVFLSPAGTPGSELLGVAAVSSADLWSVGENADERRTLIEHFTCQ
jgi:hypothetical protein